MITAITFFLLTALLLWFIIGGRGRWQWKLPLIVVVPVFMFAIWYSMASFNGYPVRSPLPKRSLFVYGYYVDPNPAQHKTGAIYVWVIPPKPHSLNPYGYEPSSTEPKAFKLPYNEKDAEQVQSATQATKKGHRVELRKGSPGSRGHRLAGRRAQPSSAHRGNSAAGGMFHAYVLPPATLPQKRR